MDLRPQLKALLSDVSLRCSECGLCREECGFLAKYGLPKQIANSYDPHDPKFLNMPFECSLCGLCSAVCPLGLDPSALHLEMRREATERGVTFSGHSRILNFERRGISRRFTYYALPEGCDTVFFPGCNLPGSRPDKVLALFELLRKDIHALGIVLDCCTKPSHDLGREKYFQNVFGELHEYLIAEGIRIVIVACPNCYKVFNSYGEALQVKSIYEILAQKGLPGIANLSDRIITIHDPCATRSNIVIHSAARSIISKTGLNIKEMDHSKERTICCGEGGTVCAIMPSLAKRWGNIRRHEANRNLIITYCAGCTAFLNRITPTVHLVDLIFDTDAAINGKIKIPCAPFTYLNRLRLKRLFKNRVNAKVIRERTQQLL